MNNNIDKQINKQVNNQNIRTYSAKEHIEQLKIAVKIENLTIFHKGKPTIFNINLEILSGNIVAILGPDNAGKTTLLKAIAGIEKKLSGNVYVFSKPSRAIKNDVAYIPARNSINWDFPISVYELVLMGSYNKLKQIDFPSEKDKISVIDAITRLGLDNIMKKNISELSRGEKYRVMVARALAQNPRIFIMDDPMVASDQESINIIIDLFQELKNKGRTIIVAHNDFMMFPCYYNKVAFLNTHLMDYGDVKDILNEANFEKTYGFKFHVLKNLNCFVN